MQTSNYKKQKSDRTDDYYIVLISHSSCGVGEGTESSCDTTTVMMTCTSHHDRAADATDRPNANSKHC